MKPLKTYQCVAAITGSKYPGEVKAKSKAEAIQLAWDLDTANVSICCQCSSQIEDPEITRIEVEVED